jgi:hypothetical protein
VVPPKDNVVLETVVIVVNWRYTEPNDVAVVVEVTVSVVISVVVLLGPVLTK